LPRPAGATGDFIPDWATLDESDISQKAPASKEPWTYVASGKGKTGDYELMTRQFMKYRGTCASSFHALSFQNHVSFPV
jgi:hypothetical protein